MIIQVKQIRKFYQEYSTLKLLPQKMHFKTFVSKRHWKIDPSKNVFQNY